MDRRRTVNLGFNEYTVINQRRAIRIVDLGFNGYKQPKKSDYGRMK